MRCGISRVTLIVAVVTLTLIYSYMISINYSPPSHYAKQESDSRRSFSLTSTTT